MRERENVINEWEKTGSEKKRYCVFARVGERKREKKREKEWGSYSKENLSPIFSRATSASASLSIPINHRRTTARTRINTRPKIHAGSFSCHDAIATCDHRPTFSWRSHIGASRARHACMWLLFTILSLFDVIYVLAHNGQHRSHIDKLMQLSIRETYRKYTCNKYVYIYYRTF